MFCPQCRTEYRAGFDVCADCHIQLVDVLKPEPQPEYVEFDHILDTYNPADIAIIKSILESENLTFHFQGDHLTLRPIGEPARLMVDRQQAAIAKELLKDLKLSYLEPSIRKDEEQTGET
jgi:hypothetical protein